MGWLKTYWLFSFSDYYDPGNLSHGMLRVFNHDIVAPGTGFDTHPHEEMEIISIILDGEMVHEDTMGNKTVIRKNDVQRMTAGTGLFHSEKNHGNAPVHFCQIWIKPDKSGLSPSYDQKKFSPETWKNKLVQIASGKGDKGVVALNTDASIHRAVLDPGNCIHFNPDKTRKPFIYILKGRLELNEKPMETNDQARISDENRLSITAIDETDFILIDAAA